MSSPSTLATGPVTVTATVPGDKSIAIRALLLALLADDPSRIDNVPDSRISEVTIRALRTLGADVTVTRVAPGRAVDSGSLTVVVVPPARLTQQTTIDCGGSATLVRLLMGLLAGASVDATLVGSSMLSRRPMGRVADPLRALFGRDVVVTTDGHLPVRLQSGAGPQPHGVITPGDSAQVRAAVMLAAVAAAVPVTLWSAQPGRRHTEQLLARLGCGVIDDDVDADSGRARRTRLHPVPVVGFSVTVPADPSAAAFMQALSATGGTALRIDHLVVDAERRGFIDVLARMGARVDIDNVVVAHGLRTATVTTGPGLLAGVDVSAREVPDLVDEVPILAALCTRGMAPSTLRGLAELRVKESDRLARIIDLLQAFGATATMIDDDSLQVTPGPSRLPERIIQTDHDHRIAMTAAVLAGMQQGGGDDVSEAVVLDDPDCADESWPGFVAQLAAVRASLMDPPTSPR
jgi:3-phosphoshikimate 1-carboxyvinyltransferase